MGSSHATLQQSLPFNNMADLLAHETEAHALRRDTGACASNISAPGKDNVVHPGQQPPQMEVDGSVLEGGGQILRMSAAFACILGFPIRISKIRAGRAKPGLAAQHLESLRLVRDVCQGTLTNDYVRSKEVTLTPGQVRPGSFDADPGTPGSITMMVQASLFPLFFAGGASTANLNGGTDVPHSPPLDFLQHVLLPSLNKMGATVNVECVKRGFLPHGGGHVKLQVPSFVEPLKAIDLSERGDVMSADVRIYSTRPLGAVQAVISDAVRKIVEPLAPIYRLEFDLAPSSDDGPIMYFVSILVETNTTARFHGSSVPSALKDNPAGDSMDEELVKAYSQACRKVCESLDRQLASGAATDEHLLDQLILPASLARGTSRLLAAEPSLHARTALHIAKMLVPGVQVRECQQDGLTLIEIEGVGHRAVENTNSSSVTDAETEARRHANDVQRRSDRYTRELLCLKDTDDGVASLRAALDTLPPNVIVLLFHGYAMAGRIKLLSAMLDVGACDVNVARQKDGCTALHIAEYKGYTDMADLLRAHSADPQARNKFGETPAEAAAARHGGA